MVGKMHHNHRRLRQLHLRKLWIRKIWPMRQRQPVSKISDRGWKSRRWTCNDLRTVWSRWKLKKWRWRETYHLWDQKTSNCEVTQRPWLPKNGSCRQPTPISRTDFKPWPSHTCRWVVDPDKFVSGDLHWIQLPSGPSGRRNAPGGAAENADVFGGREEGHREVVQKFGTGKAPVGESGAEGQRYA